MYDYYTCQKLYEAKQRDFMDEAARARLLKQVEARTPARPGLRFVAALGLAGMTVLLIISLWPRW